LQKGDVYDWVEESQDIANQLYDSVSVGEKIGYQYSYKWWGTVEIQFYFGKFFFHSTTNIRTKKESSLARTLKLVI